jgi:hypothetical protein
MEFCSPHPRTSANACLSSLMLLTTGTLRNTYQFLTLRSKRLPLKSSSRCKISFCQCKCKRRKVDLNVFVSAVSVSPSPGR